MTSVRHSRPWGPAVLCLAILGPFFFLTYGLANWVTSLRQPVPSLVFAWEHHIPFLPWTIVPYWSIDLLYAASLFVCQTRQELSTHLKRLIAAQVISVIAFLLVPLQFTFTRPEVSGVFGWLFTVLQGFDQPFNQAPSLHLSLACLLCVKYEEHVPQWARWLVRGWFVLVGVSTLMTYQHHWIDLPTGLWVGLLCLTLFRDGQTTPVISRNPGRYRLASGYASITLVCAVLAYGIGSWAWVLLWPAGACLFVSALYAAGRPDLFRKQEGRLPRATFWLLAPYLLAARLNAWCWGRREVVAHEIAPGVWLGRLPSRAERSILRIASLVDLTAELPADTADVVYRSVPMLDLLVPADNQLAAVVAAIDGLAAHRPTLVCCALGYSRSASAVAAWLLASRTTSSVAGAVEMIRARRPRIVLTEAHRARLQEFAS